jgi:hypothetical protein
MSSFKPMPFNPLARPLNLYNVKERVNVIRDVFLKVESIYAYEHERLMVRHEEELARTKDDEDDSSFNYTYSDQLRGIEEFYQRSHRISTLLLCYAFLENTMISVCDDKQKELGIQISQNELASKGIERSRNYLEKLAGIDISNSPYHGVWSRLCILNKLRNWLVHAEGNIESIKRGNPRKVIENTIGLSVDMNGLIQIEKKYVETSIDDVEVFIRFLIEKGK